MGATTLYHPVSLNVIRGSVEIRGFKFSRISQKHASQSRQVAWYNAELTKIPKDLIHASPAALHQALNECFSDDIQVTFLNYKRGKYIAELYVNCEPNPNQVKFPDEVYLIENTRR